MNRRPYLILSVIFLITLGAARLYAQQPASAPAESAAIQLTAKKYQFDPAVITIKQGDHVKLIITAADHDHGFRLAAYGINQRLAQGDPATVEFTADKAGEFPFECSVVCGLGHHKMKGKLVVEPVPGPNPPPAP